MEKHLIRYEDVEGLVYQQARKAKPALHFMEHDDIVGELATVFMKAVSSYDSSRGSFSTLYVLMMQNHVASLARQKRLEYVSMDDEAAHADWMEDGKADVFSQVMHRQTIARMLDRLPKDTRAGFALRAMINAPNWIRREFEACRDWAATDRALGGTQQAQTEITLGFIFKMMGLSHGERQKVRRQFKDAAL